MVKPTGAGCIKLSIRRQVGDLRCSRHCSVERNLALHGPDHLLDSARHKLRLARYHGETLIAVLQQHPPDDLENELRVALEAHLEGLAYTGTAAAEKTIRSVDPESVSERLPIQEMIRAALRAGPSEDAVAVIRSFEGWWVGRGRQIRCAQAARDLRNDAAHASYAKTQDGPQWQMSIRGGRDIELMTFATNYLDELADFQGVVDQAERLAATATQ